MVYEGIPIDFNNRDRWIAIIGSRKPSKKEMKMAYEFGIKCAQKNFLVVSGLAEGIDTAAHQGALAAGGKTLAVVSTSPGENIYPKSNIPLAYEIMQNGGVLYPFETKAPEKLPNEKGMSVFQKRLIERDVLVAYLSPRIFAIKQTSDPITGGTKWAMNYGETYGKDLFRMDENGQIFQNPQFQKANVYWEMEMKIEQIFNT